MVAISKESEASWSAVSSHKQMPNGTIVQSYSGLKRLNILKSSKISDSTDATQETSDASTYVLSHKEWTLCTQAGREVPCFVAHRQPHYNRFQKRQPPSRAVSSLTAPASSYQRGKWIEEKLAEFAQKKTKKNKLKWDIMGDPMGFESELFVYLPQHLPWWVFKVFPVHKWALPRQGRCFAICQHPSGKLLA